MKKPSMNKRALLLFVIFSLLFFITCYRFFTIQITGEVHGKALRAYAESKYEKESVLKASRGTIYDRNGEPLAMDTITYKLAAVLDPEMTPENAKTPNHVVDPEHTAEVLAKYIPMDEKEIYKRLKKDLFQVEFGEAGRNLSSEVKEKIEKENLPGIIFIRESKRSYPNGEFASHLLGFASYMNDEKTNEEKLVGQMGLEKSLDHELKGMDGKLEYKSDRWGYILPTGATKIKEPENGSDVYLTIDKKIQTFLEDAMNEVDEEYRPAKMMGIVADAKTGAILAMAQRPTFNPNTREGITDNWQNIIVENAFEPGSTMKIFTLAAAIEEGVWNPHELFQSGTLKVKGAPPINDHNTAGWGMITFMEGIQRSSNVAVSKLVQKMGTDTYRNYLDKFKFGKKTGIPLTNEATGTIQYQWERDRYATSYGQATSVTALQMIQAMTAITNDGKMMKPYIVEKVVNEEGKVTGKGGPEVSGTPISEKTAKEVLDIIKTTVTSDVGTARNFAIDGYEVAGKTGTAQIYEKGKGYLTGWENYIFSFIGAAPADDPRLIVYVLVQQPDLDENILESGSVPVSKIFNPVMKNSLQYLNIKPDDEKSRTNSLQLPDFSSEEVKKTVTALKSKGFEPIVLGKGTKVNDTFPAAGTKLLHGEKVIVVTDGKWKIPDLRNWSLNDVMKLAQAADIPFSFEGEGFVVKQNIKPGTVLTKDSKLKVKLKHPEKRAKPADGKDDENG